MSGPRIVCAGCGYPTTLYKPVCDDCVDILSQCHLDMGPPSKPVEPREERQPDPKDGAGLVQGSDAAAASIPE